MSRVPYHDTLHVQYHVQINVQYHVQINVHDRDRDHDRGRPGLGIPGDVPDRLQDTRGRLGVDEAHHPGLRVLGQGLRELLLRRFGADRSGRAGESEGEGEDDEKENGTSQEEDLEALIEEVQDHRVKNDALIHVL